MSIRLTCTDPNSHLDVWVESLPAILGRSTDAYVQVIDQFASRAHCELSIQDGTLRIRDLNSGNGTLVNGEQITEATIECSDTLTVGVSSFRVQFSARSLVRVSDSRGAQSLQASE